MLELLRAPRVDKEYQDEIDKAREELQNLISKEKFSAPDLLRLAYASQFSISNSHDDDAGSTPNDATTKTTQSANNNNLKTIESIKDKYPTITFPDFYQLAGVVAVEMLGGPKIEFVPGRKDSSISPDEGCLPDVKQSASDLRGVFDKVGISDPKHIVALCGGLKLARSGVLDATLKFDNSYFVDLVNKKYQSCTDKALLDDPDFNNCVHIYATNKDAFIKDYEEAHKKLSELGLPHSSFIKSALEKSTLLLNNTLAQRAAVGVAVAAAVVILGVFYLINRRRAKHSLQQFQ